MTKPSFIPKVCNSVVPISRQPEELTGYLGKEFNRMPGNWDVIFRYVNLHIMPQIKTNQ